MRRRYLLVLLVGLAALVLSSCGIGEPAANKAAAAIDKAIARMDQNLLGWQEIVKGLPAELQGLESNAARDAEMIAQKSLAAAGSNIKCVADFARSRARGDLQRLADRLRGKPTSDPQPVVCEPAPVNFSMERRPDFVEFHGYDFKLSNPDGSEVKRVRAYLRTIGSPDLPLDEWTTFASHYIVSVKVGTGSSIPLCNKPGRVIVLKAIDGSGIERELGEKSEVGIIDAVCPAAPPAPTPMPAIMVFDHHLLDGGGITGASYNRVYGPACSPNYHRLSYHASNESTGNVGWCQVNGWANDDPKSCEVEVHVGMRPFQGVDCHIVVWEVGDQLPAPEAPPCLCQ